jgi:hypothetical protein
MSTGQTAEQLFAGVPSIRRNGVMSALLFVALLFGFVLPIVVAAALPQSIVLAAMYACQAISGLALLFVCFVVLTGPVYLAQLDDKGQLKTWGVANKVVAVLILVGWAYYTVRRFIP